MILIIVFQDNRDMETRMSKMIEALKARAEQQKNRKQLTSEEMRERIENSPMMKKLREAKAKSKFNIEAKEE